jgi:hypothetical protein
MIRPQNRKNKRVVRILNEAFKNDKIKTFANKQQLAKETGLTVKKI